MIGFRSLKLSLRFVIPLVVALGLLAYGVVPLVDNLTLRWSLRDMDSRSKFITRTLQEPLQELLAQNNRQKIDNLLLRATQDERLLALGFCKQDGALIYRTPAFPAEITCASVPGVTAQFPHLIDLAQGPVHVAENPIEQDGTGIGSLILVHDMSYMVRRSDETREYVILFFVVLGVVVSLITVFVAHLSWHGWMAGVRAMLRGEGILKPFAQPKVTSEFTGAAHELHEALIVNPYHVEQTAEALYQGLTMPEYEQQERMRSMRALVRDFNVYRWAGRMLLDAARVRQREKLAMRIAQQAKSEEWL